MADTTPEYEYACQEWWPESEGWVVVGGGPGPLWQALDTLADWTRDEPFGTYQLVRREVQPWVRIDTDGEPWARGIVTPSRADRQPPNTSTNAKGGQGTAGP